MRAQLFPEPVDDRSTIIFDGYISMMCHRGIPTRVIDIHDTVDAAMAGVIKHLQDAYDKELRNKTSHMSNGRSCNGSDIVDLTRSCNGSDIVDLTS